MIQREIRCNIICNLKHFKFFRHAATNNPATIYYFIIFKKISPKLFFPKLVLITIMWRHNSASVSNCWSLFMSNQMRQYRIVLEWKSPKRSCHHFVWLDSFVLLLCKFRAFSFFSLSFLFLLLFCFHILPARVWHF